MTQERDSIRREIHFGPRKLEDVPLTALVELPQVRQEYDSAALDELAHSMIIDPSAAPGERVSSDTFELHNPIEVAVLDREHAEKFLLDHAAHYDLDPPSSSDVDALFSESEWPTLHVLYAGHRRRRAVRQLIDTYELDPAQVTISANVSHNISFTEALRRQLTENIHERPPVEDEARAIGLWYRDIQRQTGVKVPVSVFARQTGFSETKVRDALMYASLPQEIQQLTSNGFLAYSVVKRFKYIADAYEVDGSSRYPGQTDAEKQQYILDGLMAEAQMLKRQQLQGARSGRRFDAAQWIDRRVEEIRDASRYALFDLEAAEPARRRRRAAKMLTAQALNTIEYQLETGDFDQRRVEELELLLAKARELTGGDQGAEVLSLFDEQAV